MPPGERSCAGKWTPKSRTSRGRRSAVLSFHDLHADDRLDAVAPGEDDELAVALPGRDHSPSACLLQGSFILEFPVIVGDGVLVLLHHIVDRIVGLVGDGNVRAFGLDPVGGKGALDRIEGHVFRDIVAESVDRFVL